MFTIKLAATVHRAYLQRARIVCQWRLAMMRAIIISFAMANWKYIHSFRLPFTQILSCHWEFFAFLFAFWRSTIYACPNAECRTLNAECDEMQVANSFVTHPPYTHRLTNKTQNLSRRTDNPLICVALLSQSSAYFLVCCTFCSLLLCEPACLRVRAFVSVSFVIIAVVIGNGKYILSLSILAFYRVRMCVCVVECSVRMHIMCRKISHPAQIDEER